MTTERPGIGTRVIAGYPVDALRSHLERAQSLPKRMDAIFNQEGAEDLTPELIDRLVSQGWERKPLEEGARAGARYSPSRDSLLFPAFAGGFDDDDDSDLGISGAR